MHKVFGLTILMIAIASRSFGAEIANPISPGITQESFSSSFDETPQTYLVKDFRPREQTDAPLLVIYLHGAIAHQDQGMTAGIYGNVFGRLANELERLSAIYVCPEYRGGSWMGPSAEADLVQIISNLRKQYRPGKIILIGGSMGGTSALIFAARHASELDGVIALCPATDVAAMYGAFSGQFKQSYGGSPSEVPAVYQERSARLHAEKLVTLPLVLIHGSADAVIPVEHSRNLVATLKELQARLKYLEVEGGNHDAPVYAVSWKDCFDFVLEGGKGEK